MNKYYVYKHRIKGTNEVFYIGLGSQKNYNRAKTKYGRNKHWSHVFEKYGFEYDILQDNLSLNEARELEKFLIKTYGRKDLKEGCLVNFTDGGEGTINLIKSEEQIEKWKKANKGKQDGEKNTMFGKTRGLHHLSKEVLNLQTGIYYDCALDVSTIFNIPYSTLKSKLNNNDVNNTDFIYADNYENKIPNKTKNIIEKKAVIKEDKRGWKKYILDIETGIYYDSLKELSLILNYNYSSLKTKMRANKIDFKYKYV